MERVLTAARALHEVFKPAQINFTILDNSVPHVHTYLLPVTSTILRLACP